MLPPRPSADASSSSPPPPPPPPPSGPGSVAVQARLQLRREVPNYRHRPPHDEPRGHASRRAMEDLPGDALRHRHAAELEPPPDDALEGALLVVEVVGARRRPAVVGVDVAVDGGGVVRVAVRRPPRGGGAVVLDPHHGRADEKVRFEVYHHAPTRPLRPVVDGECCRPAATAAARRGQVRPR